MSDDARRAATEHLFFSSAEWTSIHVLVDLILPSDERSGSATDADVPEVLDRILAEGPPAPRDIIRAGLRWLDLRCVRRCGASFANADERVQRELLDEIAWPASGPPDARAGTIFFTTLRDLAASAFWTSAMGYADLGVDVRTSSHRPASA